MRGGEVLSDSEALPEGEPGSAVTTQAPVPPVPPAPPEAGPVPQANAGDRYTSLSPDEAQRRLGPMLQMQGWSVTAPRPNQFDLALTVPGNPNVLVGVLLFFICIVPAIIYYIIKGRATVLQASMIFVPTEGGTRIALQGSGVALQRLGPVMVMLPW